MSLMIGIEKPMLWFSPQHAGYPTVVNKMIAGRPIPDNYVPHMFGYEVKENQWFKLVLVRNIFANRRKGNWLQQWKYIPLNQVPVDYQVQALLLK